MSSDTSQQLGVEVAARYSSARQASLVDLGRGRAGDARGCGTVPPRGL